MMSDLRRARRLAAAWGAPWPTEMEHRTAAFLDQHLGRSFELTSATRE